MVESSSSRGMGTSAFFINDGYSMVLLVVTEKGNEIVLEYDFGTKEGGPEFHHGGDIGSFENNVGQATWSQGKSVAHNGNCGFEM